MILPIVAYGSPVLKEKAESIKPDYPELQTLIDNMFETMYSAHGVGLAAPQIGKSIRLFIVDVTPFAEDDASLDGIKKVFINPEIILEEGTEWKFNEGCLSIPTIREDISRKPNISIRYQDEHFVEHQEEISGLLARVIQHEYDHIEGILFTDRISQLRKTLIRAKLINISKGNVKVDYKMKFPVLKK
jgi:peptide deformylase